MINSRNNSWAVIGGGMLGMTIAYRLAQKGQAVTLLEGAPTLGGLASAWTVGNITWDRHYHVTLFSDSAVRSLLEEIGLGDQIQWTETKTGFYTDNKLYSMSNSLEFLKFPPLNLVDKLRLGATIFYASRVKDWKSLENVPVADWLTRLSGRSTFEKIWLPLLRSKLGENYKKTSAAFIWATIARMYAARRTGLKKEMFGYVNGGYARVLDSFANELRSKGVVIKTGQRIRAITPAGLSEFDVSLSDGPVQRFGKVIVTVPSPVAASICEGLREDEYERLRGVEYQGIVCASVILRRPLGGYYVTNITEPDIPFTAVIEMSALVDRSHFGGQSLVYLPKYVEPNDTLFDFSDSQIEDLFMDGLTRMYPDLTREDVAAFKISRVRQVFPLPTLGYSSRVPGVRTSQDGLFTVNSAQIVNGTLNVNETVQLANRTADELLAA